MPAGKEKHPNIRDRCYQRLPAWMQKFFAILKQLPWQVWIAFVLHMFDAFAYFAISTNLTIYLTTNFGVDDVTAGVYYGIWGGLLVGFGIPTGFLIDKLGIKKSLVVGALFNASSRTLFALSDSLPVTLGALFLGTTVGAGFFISVLHVAVKRYTQDSKQHSTVAFALLYTFMNMGAVVAMLSTDLALESSLYFEGYRLLFVVGAAVSIITLVIAVLYRDREDMILEERTTMRQCFHVFTEKEFWRLVGITLFLIGVRSMFRHIETLLPKWLTRVYPGIHYGSVLALNPTLIIFLTPIVGTLTRNLRAVYWMIVIGAAVSAISPLPTWLWVTATLIAMFINIAVFTIGESIYSPKLGQIVLERSPPGKEGIYSGLLPIPYFAGNIFSGLFSGWLLDAYCPELEGSNASSSVLEFDPSRAAECNKVWGWVILTAATSPLLLIVFCKLLNPKEGVVERYIRLKENVEEEDIQEEQQQQQ